MQQFDQSWNIRWYGPQEPGREAVEEYIQARFAVEHAARVQHFLPFLVALANDAAGERPLAAMGLRPAAGGRLYLEHYLDHPVERMIGREVGTIPAREGIVEIGNLAASDRVALRTFFAGVGASLGRLGYSWVVCTAGSRLELALRHFGIKPVVLAAASQERLPEEQRQWGSYYDEQPRVLAGMVEQGWRALSSKLPDGLADAFVANLPVDMPHPHGELAA